MGTPQAQINDHHDGRAQAKGAMMRTWVSLGLLIASTVGAYAGSQTVPEIDAFSLLAAMALGGSIAALIWERKRK